MGTSAPVDGAGGIAGSVRSVLISLKAEGGVVLESFRVMDGSSGDGSFRRARKTDR